MTLSLESMKHFLFNLIVHKNEVILSVNLYIFVYNSQIKSKV